MRFRLGGRNERSSESRVKLAWAMPSRDDIAESNEGMISVINNGDRHFTEPVPGIIG